MTTHDVLAFAVAQSAVLDIRSGSPSWSAALAVDVHVTSSRAWPQPDFVLVDGHGLALGAEFKPPAQSKREYLTGLGQAVAYTRDFSYAALIIPDISDHCFRLGRPAYAVLRPATGRRSSASTRSAPPTRG